MRKKFKIRLDDFRNDDKKKKAFFFNFRMNYSTEFDINILYVLNKDSFLLIFFFFFYGWYEKIVKRKDA